MPRSLFYDIPCYATIGYEKRFTPVFICKMLRNPWTEMQNQVNYIRLQVSDQMSTLNVPCKQVRNHFSVDFTK